MRKNQRIPAAQGRPGAAPAWRSWGLAAAVLLTIGIGAGTWLLLARMDAPGHAAQFTGGARLAVDRDLIDFGVVPFRQMVEATFRVQNVGDKPLSLPAAPPLDVLEGC